MLEEVAMKNQDTKIENEKRLSELKKESKVAGECENDESLKAHGIMIQVFQRNESHINSLMLIWMYYCMKVGFRLKI